MAGNAPELEKHLARHAGCDENFFTALNTAFFQDGAFVSVAAGKTADKPVHLLYRRRLRAARRGRLMPRNLILARRRRSAESHRILRQPDGSARMSPTR